jgi:hypothetical protein
MEGVSSIRNQRTRHAVVTRDSPSMVGVQVIHKNIAHNKTTSASSLASLSYTSFVTAAFKELFLLLNLCQ